MEVIRGMYGQLQAEIIANNLLTQNLRNHGYYQVKKTPGFWQYMWRTISFTLVVEMFVIGYVKQENTDHLMSALKMYYEK